MFCLDKSSLYAIFNAVKQNSAGPGVISLHLYESRTTVLSNRLFEQKFLKEGFQNLAEIKRMLTEKL